MLLPQDRYFLAVHSNNEDYGYGDYGYGDNGNGDDGYGVSWQAEPTTDQCNLQCQPCMEHACVEELSDEFMSQHPECGTWVCSECANIK